MGCKLTDAGISDFVIFEKAARPGGVWRDNVYPGVACDVPSHLYCWSDELNPDWSHQYAPGAEIQSYIERIIEKRGLTARIRYGTEVTAARWYGGQWKLTANRGEPVTADIVVSATGVLHHPAYPEINGLDQFAGPMFHTARWRSDVSLEGERVGVIGTGTTASQVITAIAARVGELHVFQRTPSWVLDVPNAPNPGWQKSALRSMPWAYRWMNRVGTHLIARTYGEFFLRRSPLTSKYIELRCQASLRQVRDPDLRKALTPSYAPGCKRIVFTAGYYQAIQLPNVRLITERIARVERDGVVTADGRRHELGILILATGFKADSFIRPMTLEGEGGTSIEQVWAHKLLTYRSIAIPRMPNFFTIVGPYSPLANVSTIEVAEWQIGYVMRCIDLIRRENVCLAPFDSAAQEYVRGLDHAAKQTVWASGCKSWYLGSDRLPQLYTKSPLQHRAELAEAPNLKHFDVRPRTAAGAATSN